MPVRQEPYVWNGSTAKSVDDKAVTSVWGQSYTANQLRTIRWILGIMDG